MPSSGYPSVDLIAGIVDEADHTRVCRAVIERAKTAMEAGLFIEWLEAFVGAWNETQDPWIASWAGLEEWDI